MNGTTDRDVQHAHLVIADESLPATGVVWVERPSAVKRLQRVTDRLRHDPGSELFMGELPVGTLDEEGQQVSGRHSVLISSGVGPGLPSSAAHMTAVHLVPPTRLCPFRSHALPTFRPGNPPAPTRNLTHRTRLGCAVAATAGQHRQPRSAASFQWPDVPA